MADHLTAAGRTAQWTDARKFLVHLAVPLLALVLASRDGLTALEALQVTVLLCGSAAVYIVRNGLTGPWQYAKALAAWVAVVAAAAVPYALEGWRGLLVGAPAIVAAAAGALGVGVVPNTGTATLADAVADILEQLHEVRSALPPTPGPLQTAVARRAAQPQVRAEHAPARPTRAEEAAGRAARAAEAAGASEHVGLSTEQLNAVPGPGRGTFL